MSQQVRQKIFLNGRFLFIKDGCHLCMKWKEFVERVNMELPIEKKIRIINCTVYETLGIVDNEFIKVFDSYFENYPTLFLEGNKLPYTNSREETEAFIRAYLHDDFIIPRRNPLLFDQQCSWVKKGLFGRKTLVCVNQ